MASLLECNARAAPRPEVLSGPDFVLTVCFAQLGGAGVTDAMLAA